MPGGVGCPGHFHDQNTSLFAESEEYIRFFVVTGQSTGQQVTSNGLGYLNKPV